MGTCNLNKPADFSKSTQNLGKSLQGPFQPDMCPIMIINCEYTGRLQIVQESSALTGQVTQAIGVHIPLQEKQTSSQFFQLLLSHVLLIYQRTCWQVSDCRNFQSWLWLRVIIPKGHFHILQLGTAWVKVNGPIVVVKWWLVWGLFISIKVPLFSCRQQCCWL